MVLTDTVTYVTVPATSPESSSEDRDSVHFKLLIGELDLGALALAKLEQLVKPLDFSMIEGGISENSDFCFCPGRQYLQIP